VTLSPGEACAPAGVPPEQLVDALHVCALFNLIDRVADALGFDLPTDEEHAAYAPRFLAEGYGNEV
jgi:hypothetical protein